jgi:hypothetical protein
VDEKIQAVLCVDLGKRKINPENHANDREDPKGCLGRLYLFMLEQ